MEEQKIVETVTLGKKRRNRNYLSASDNRRRIDEYIVMAILPNGENIEIKTYMGNYNRWIEGLQAVITFEKMELLGGIEYRLESLEIIYSNNQKPESVISNFVEDTKLNISQFVASKGIKKEKVTTNKSEHRLFPFISLLAIGVIAAMIALQVIYNQTGVKEPFNSKYMVINIFAAIEFANIFLSFLFRKKQLVTRRIYILSYLCIWEIINISLFILTKKGLYVGYLIFYAVLIVLYILFTMGKGKNIEDKRTVRRYEVREKNNTSEGCEIIMASYDMDNVATGYPYVRYITSLPDKYNVGVVIELDIKKINKLELNTDNPNKWMFDISYLHEGYVKVGNNIRIF